MSEKPPAFLVSPAFFGAARPPLVGLDGEPGPDASQLYGGVNLPALQAEVSRDPTPHELVGRRRQGIKKGEEIELNYQGQLMFWMLVGLLLPRL